MPSKSTRVKRKEHQSTQPEKSGCLNPPNLDKPLPPTPLTPRCPQRIQEPLVQVQVQYTCIMRRSPTGVPRVILVERRSSS